MAKIELQVQPREEAGKNRVDKLRAAGLIPGVIYQKEEAPKSVKVKEREFSRVYHEAGTSTLVELKGEDIHETVLIKEVQRHPFRDDILHVDFQGVRMDEKIRLLVPVVLLNREEIRVQPSVLMQMVDEIEIECLPGDIPAQAEVDVVNMQIGDVITAQDLDIAKNDKITLLVDLEEPVASLSEPQEQTEGQGQEEAAEGEEVSAEQEKTEE